MNGTQLRPVRHMVPTAGSRSPSIVEATEPIVEAVMDLDVAEVHSASLNTRGGKLFLVNGLCANRCGASPDFVRGDYLPSPDFMRGVSRLPRLQSRR